MDKWTNFGDLDLSGVEESKSRLQPGKYLVVCREAKIEQVEGTQNRRVVALFEDEDGIGDIRMNFNVFHTNAQAQEIGLRQLKTFLVAAGHKNPDKPGDIGTLRGLRCGVVVGLGKPWTDKDGKSRQNSEVKQFYNPDHEPASPAPAASDKRGKELNDAVPF
jgi:hypothetical protein